MNTISQAKSFLETESGQKILKTIIIAEELSVVDITKKLLGESEPGTFLVFLRVKDQPSTMTMYLTLYDEERKERGYIAQSANKDIIISNLIMEKEND